MKRKALISVSDKTDIISLAENLIKNNFEILATGNTSKLLKENNILCTEISEYTGSPEIFSGRVKTLHPKVFGGILFRRDLGNDLSEAEQNGISPIDIVVVNLYPFPKVVNREDIDNETKIENIDIGGPSLIRAAAKNYKYISVLTSPLQYKDFINELNKSEISESTRKKLASEAFSHTANYDRMIADFYEEKVVGKEKSLRINLPFLQELRYGENPHQKAFLYGNFFEYYEILHGKELSYNNIVDLDAAVNLVSELNDNSCVIIKHTNPCGAATGTSVYDAYEKALSCDPVSAFGGIVAFNGMVNEKVAEKLNEIFTEVVCANDFSNEALEILRKKKNRRIIKILKLNSNQINYKNITGGILVQQFDNSKFPISEYKVVTKIDVTKKELENLEFAWVVCKHTKSNAIVFAKDLMAIGVGAGQMSRVDSVRIAVAKAKQNGHILSGAVAASDAFFPFADGVEEIASNEITAIVQPGGSVRDAEVIEAANNKNIAMIFSGIRNFKH